MTRGTDLTIIDYTDGKIHNPKSRTPLQNRESVSLVPSPQHRLKASSELLF
jgi:hypothetical protein